MENSKIHDLKIVDTCIDADLKLKNYLAGIIKDTEIEEFNKIELETQKLKADGLTRKEDYLSSKEDLEAKLEEANEEINDVAKTLDGISIDDISDENLAEVLEKLQFELNVLETQKRNLSRATHNYSKNDNNLKSTYIKYRTTREKFDKMKEEIDKKKSKKEETRKEIEKKILITLNKITDEKTKEDLQEAMRANKDTTNVYKLRATDSSLGGACICLATQAQEKTSNKERMEESGYFYCKHCNRITIKSIN